MWITLSLWCSMPVYLRLIKGGINWGPEADCARAVGKQQERLNECKATKVPVYTAGGSQMHLLLPVFMCKSLYHSLVIKRALDRHDWSRPL